MLLEITNCTDGMMWYSKHIGEKFNIIEDWGTEFKVRDAYGHLNIVLKKDCVVL